MEPTSPDGQVKVTVSGLTKAEAERRLKQFGPNEIPERRRHPLLQLLGKFWGPIPWMLEATILLQIFLGKRGEAAIIAILLAVNAGVSFVQEGRASKALDLLRHRLSAQARVFRDGAWRPVAAKELVPGDIVHLRMGDRAPADICIVDGRLLLDQSALTGESAAVEAGPGDITYAASVVRRGEVTGEVTATGARTYFGKTAELLRGAEPASHLAKTIFKIVRVLIAIDSMLIAALLAYSAWTGLPFQDVLPFALILLVASVPAALPATFTLATAIGAAELAQSGVLLTRLSAIEEAAGMDVLCTDKTGTLTQNQLSLAEMKCFGTVSENELLQLAVLACDPATQDPIDLAILSTAKARNLSVTLPERIAFVPFDPANRYTLGGYRLPDGERWVVKGAPLSVTAMIADSPDVSEAVDLLAASGARVLAVAHGSSRKNLQLGGLIALEDPPRTDSAALINGLKNLGIRVMMVTGDNAATASAIAERVGIKGPVATAETIERVGGEDALDYGVYAGVFPEHKIRLIRQLQATGHVVGMTGDGVNDAPALKQADVGIAVASATDVARSAAAVALTAPGLVDALAVVQISRRIYQRMLTYTINKIMKTLEIAVFLTIGVITTHAFVISPLLIVLLLFTNDFVTMSIATDHVGFSQTPDRWNVGKLMLIGSALAASMLILTFSAFFFSRSVLGLNLPELQTLVFVMLVATGQGNVYLVRERGPFWRSLPSRWLITSSIIDLIVVIVLATTGVLMTPISMTLIVILLVVVAIYLLFLDQLKVRLFHHLKVA